MNNSGLWRKGALARLNGISKNQLTKGLYMEDSKDARDGWNAMADHIELDDMLKRHLERGTPKSAHDPSYPY